jgi:CheY-like chemotaxis protein
MEIVESPSKLSDQVFSKATAGHAILISSAIPADSNLVTCLDGLRYTVDAIPCNAAAIPHIIGSRAKTHVIVVDRRGAKVDSIAIIRRIASDPRIADLPLLMLVGSKDDEQAIAAFDADIVTHLRVPFSVTVLDASLRALRRQRQKRAAERLRPTMERSVLAMADTCKFRFRTPAEAKQLTPLLAAFFPDRQRAEIGIADLLSNAIEHGNLQIGGELKVKLSAEGGLKNEIYSRLNKPEYASRFVEVMVTRKDDGVMLVVNDDGAGFEWKDYLDVNPAFANRDHGRGIARARHMAFDKLTYNKAGNQVVALMTGSQSLDW